METFHFILFKKIFYRPFYSLKFKFILATLILEEFAIDQTVKKIKASFYRDVHNIAQAPVQVISPLYRTTPEASQSTLK